MNVLPTCYNIWNRWLVESIEYTNKHQIYEIGAKMLVQSWWGEPVKETRLYSKLIIFQNDQSASTLNPPQFYPPPFWFPSCVGRTRSCSRALSLGEENGDRDVKQLTINNIHFYYHCRPTLRGCCPVHPFHSATISIHPASWERPLNVWITKYIISMSLFHLIIEK